MITLRTLPVTFRALFSSFLVVVGIGYLMALTLLFLVDIAPHVGSRLTVVEDIDLAYHGQPHGTRLESALAGPMANMASSEDKTRILDWVHAGGSREQYADVQPIFAKNCVVCHNPTANPQLPDLTNFDGVQKVLRVDLGPSVAQLARVSHIHLFGISLIFLLTGGIFAFSEAPTWLKVSLVSIPYLSIILDIGSWWGTKYLDPLFAYIVIVGGALMGVALAGQILISLWQMWMGPLIDALGRSRVRRGPSGVAPASPASAE